MCIRDRDKPKPRGAFHCNLPVFQKRAKSVSFFFHAETETCISPAKSTALRDWNAVLFSDLNAQLFDLAPQGGGDDAQLLRGDGPVSVVALQRLQNPLAFPALPCLLYTSMPTGCAGAMMAFGIGNHNAFKVMKFTLPLVLLLMISLIIGVNLFFPIYN